MQRSWGSTGHGVFQKQPGGWCGWNRVSKERRGGGEGREGTGQVMRGLGDHREDLGFSPKEMGAWEGCGQRIGPDWCSQMPSGGHFMGCQGRCPHGRQSHLSH